MFNHSKPIVIRLAIGLACALLVVPAVRSGDPPSYYEAREARLDVRMDELVLEDATLDEAVALLREKTHANIIIAWRDLEKDGFQRTARASLRVRDATLARALNLLSVAYGDNARPLSMRVHAGIIHVEYPVKELTTQVPTLIYDVADFTARFIAPNDTNVAGRGLFSGAPTSTVLPRPGTQVASPAMSNMSRQECIDALVRLIQELVLPESWRDNGGQTGAIKEVGGLLVITQSPATHVKVQTLLRNLRKLRAAIDRGEPISSEGIDLMKP